MRKHLAQLFFTIIFLSILGLSACQPEPEPALDPALVEATMQASVIQTLTAAPTSTPLPTSTSTATPTITATPKIVNYGPTNFPANVNPLTGLEMDDPSILDRRPVLVKVANQMAARPHAGLSNADIVFDYYTGEGGDRFVALYYGKDDSNVGTIRSGRYIDIPLVQMYNGILGMVSAYKPELDKILSSLGGRVINTEHCGTYKAICDDGSNTETSVFANTAEMTKLFASRSGADNSKQNLDGMSFATIPPAGGAAASQFTMHYGGNNNHQWNYDPATGKYLQSLEMIDFKGNFTISPLVDRNNNVRLAFSNVVVIFAKIDTLNGEHDTIHEYSFTGRGGRALVCRDGKVYDVFYKYTWNQPFAFVDADGNPVPLQPGNTWIHITGLSSSVKEDPSGVWTVNLIKP